MSCMSYNMGRMLQQIAADGVASGRWQVNQNMYEFIRIAYVMLFVCHIPCTPIGYSTWVYGLPKKILTHSHLYSFIRIGFTFSFLFISRIFVHYVTWIVGRYLHMTLYVYLLWIINGITWSRARDRDIFKCTMHKHIFFRFSTIEVVLLPRLLSHFKTWLSWFIFYYNGRRAGWWGMGMDVFRFISFIFFFLYFLLFH